MPAAIRQHGEKTDVSQSCFRQHGEKTDVIHSCFILREGSVQALPSKAFTMERILCHFEVQTQLSDEAGHDLHNVLFYSVQHTETVPSGNAMHKRHCFSWCDVKRTCHSEKLNYPSRKTYFFLLQ